MSKQVRARALVWAATVAGLGCAGGGDGEPPLALEAGPADVAIPSVDAAAPSCPEGLQRPCTCGPGELGTQRCIDGEFAACTACTARSDDRPRCAAGNYHGRLRGSYRAETLGLCTLLSGDEAPLDFEVTFTLRQEGSREFYSVQGGCLRVPGEETRSSDADTSYGLTFELTGSVDCSSGAVDFNLRGTYVSKSVCTLGTSWDRYFTEGTVTGRFDPDTNSFVDTTWFLRERTPLLGEPTGGRGTFTATLDSDGDPPDFATGADCLGADFPADLAPVPVSVE